MGDRQGRHVSVRSEVVVVAGEQDAEMIDASERWRKGRSEIHADRCKFS